MNNKIITKEELYNNIAAHSKKLTQSVFITPTDTIYGLSCNALNNDLVNTIRDLKDRNERPFSVIPPTKEWIFDNCETDSEEIREKIAMLPGPYTLILKLKNLEAIAKSVVAGKNTIGVRIPNHWIADIAQKIKVPIVTTSANKTGENFMTSIDNLDKDILNNVSMVLYEGELNGHPSTIFRLDKDETEIIERKK